MFEQEAGIDSTYKSAAILRDSMTLEDKNVTMSFFKGSTTFVLAFVLAFERVIINHCFRGLLKS